MERKEGLLFVVSGASGTGKTTLCRAMLKIYPNLRFSVSHTTRPRRPRDENGRDYYFVSAEEFQRMVDQGDFAEWAEIYGRRYGTSKKMLEKARAEGQDLILDIDSQGARQLRQQGLPGVFVFVLPPSLTELKQRLMKRKTEEKEALEERLKKARDEIVEARWYDYLILNNELERAQEQLQAIILAEHCRRERMAEALERLLLEK
ncbi:MAG TPA: guanylate kinase [Thermodesulfobacteriota bacterium]|nr:guanylate kinase [Thermodesulfobacteriota bacterium]